MPFQYTFRSDDISTWDVDTRDLVENRDRELELYSTTIDTSFLNLNASNLTLGTVPSARMTGAYTGITGLGALTSLDVQTTTGTAVRITNTGTGNSFLVEDSASTDATPFVINAAGNVGIGVSSPSNALDVSGNVQITGGNFVVGGSGTFFNTSAEDGIILSPRLGGTGSYRVVFTPTTLSASRTVTLPNATGTMITTGNLSDITSVAATALTGTIASARISGSYTGITGVGTITTGTWSGSFGAVSGANLTNLNASNLASGGVPGGRLSGSYTGITGVGTLAQELNVSGAACGFNFADRSGTGEKFILYSSSADAFLYSTRLGANILGFARTTGQMYVYYGVNGSPLYGSYGTFNIYGSSGGWGGITFPDHTSSMMIQNTYFGHYRNNTTWNFYVNNGTYVPSDERYKRDIQPLENGLNFIREIIPVTYDPLTESLDDDPETTVGKTHYGFTTQNILQALSNAGETRDVAVVDIGGPSTEGTNSDRQYLNHSALIAPMVKAIQELDARLQQLETV